ncbi:MAG: O-antigen ligase family protein [Lachnospiraceae bacterium]|nr:O-antigen ligase family protein [Lachnospiraceae bacterium]
MIITEKSEKRILVGNIALMATVFILTTAEWHFYSWYEWISPYGTIIASLGLIIALVCYVDIKEMVRDPAFILMAAADIIAFLNLILIGSGKGAILTVADFLLILYLSNKIRLSNRQIVLTMCYIGFFFVYWTIDVKGYFKGYNTNYGGLVLISGFFFAVYAVEYLRVYLTEKKGYNKAKWLLLFTFVLFVWGYKIIAWYRSRCALLGLIMFALLMLVPLKIWKNKIFYVFITLSTTVGGVLFTLLYVWLGVMKDSFRIQIFYKDIISGREEIWSELWREFIRHPVTGIGSSYEMKLDWLNGMFEVHNGLLDILIVHGVAVFAVVIVFIIKRFLELRKYCVLGPVNKCATAGVFAMMLPAFMENYIIVPPFSVILLLLISMAGADMDFGNVVHR